MALLLAMFTQFFSDPSVQWLLLTRLCETLMVAFAIITVDEPFATTLKRDALCVFAALLWWSLASFLTWLFQRQKNGKAPITNAYTTAMR